jgi:hypothetical protein
MIEILIPKWVVVIIVVIYAIKVLTGLLEVYVRNEQKKIDRAELKFHEKKKD